MDYILPSAQLAGRRELHPSQHQHHVTPLNAELHVVTSISNPSRYYSRYRLYRAFEKHMADSGAILYTVELALRNRHFEVTSHDNPRHFQLRTPNELWHKENLLNYAIQRLPSNWEYVAWIDADVLFMRPDWVMETLHRLQHHKVLQLFSHAVDLGPDFQPVTTAESFMASHVNGRPRPPFVNSKGDMQWDGYSYSGGGFKWHPGYAWAARRSAISDLGGLGDVAILGSGDHHMACALVGRVNDSIHQGASKSFKDYWRRWQARADRHIAGDVGYVPGTIAHYWHGKKVDRKYVDRWQILIGNQYDHTKDIYRDAQGIYQLSGKPRLRDQLRMYFAQRNEDSVDI